MREEVVDIERRLVRASFEWPSRQEGEGNRFQIYQVAMESPDFFAVLEHALGLGYEPETFRQTVFDGSGAHLRLKSVKGDSGIYARVTSLQQDNAIKYRLYVPKAQE